MRLHLQAFILIFLTFKLTSCISDNKTDDISIFRVDSTIKNKALQNIKSVSNDYFTSKLNATYYENDNLSEAENDSTENLWGRYGWHNDTLSITANAGVLNTTGFIADIYKDKTSDIRHNKCAHERGDNFFKIRITDTLSQCVKVPCTYSELIVSSLPDSTKNEGIYGFVRFKSGDYYYQQNQHTTKLRTDMSFYFRAINFDRYLKSLKQ